MLRCRRCRFHITFILVTLALVRAFNSQIHFENLRVHHSLQKNVSPEKLNTGLNSSDGLFCWRWARKHRDDEAIGEQEQCQVAL